MTVSVVGGVNKVGNKDLYKTAQARNWLFFFFLNLAKMNWSELLSWTSFVLLLNVFS